MADEKKKAPKTAAELEALKKEVASLNEKLSELNEDELNEVAGGCYVGTRGFP